MGVITTDQPEKRVKLSWTTPVNSLELQDPGKPTSRSTAKRSTIEWTPEPMSKWPQADTSPPNSPLIQKSNKKLFGPGKTEIDVSGHFPATLETDHTKTKQTSSQ